MAKLTVTRGEEHGSMTDVIHRCGEMLQMESTRNHLVRFRSMYGSVITQCSHCLEDIEFEDVQTPHMVDELGFPD